jgi:hypothetical protein
MKPRITISLSAYGELQIWLNPEGRDSLIRELQALNEKHDHFHLAPDGMGDVETSKRVYRADDQLLEWGKVMFRTDAWDREHFPHVMA